MEQVSQILESKLGREYCSPVANSQSPGLVGVGQDLVMELLKDLNIAGEVTLSHDLIGKDPEPVEEFVEDQDLVGRGMF